ncbi:unnamed protein product [Allacma fusca]|uniref:Uncharacterized protein n=1 Tax=Allacma fusca TaxID=39272 RepID=A0A8J2J4S5_9HEXA|nr:unnamed protein product [Allacma fusca]
MTLYAPYNYCAFFNFYITKGTPHVVQQFQRHLVPLGSGGEECPSVPYFIGNPNPYINNQLTMETTPHVNDGGAQPNYPPSGC